MSQILLARIAREVEVLDRRTYKVNETRREFAAPSWQGELEDDAWVRFAGAALGNMIYRVYYLGRPLAEREETLTSAARREDRDLGRTLREANSGVGWWSRGWRLTRRVDQGWEVERGGLRLRARPDQVSAAEPEAVGVAVNVRFPKHFPYRSPGFYTAVGDAGPAREQIQRFYLSLRQEAAASTLRAITTGLSAWGTPFLVKVANNPGQFDRPDALTLYLEREHVEQRLAQLADLFGSLASALRSADAPGFAFRWMPGVAFAQEPPPGRGTVHSFGEHRSRLIGRAIASAFLDGRARLAAILQAINEQGLSSGHLYLNPGESSPLGELQA